MESKGGQKILETKKIEYKLENTTEYALNDFFFDPHVVVNNFLQGHPRFAAKYSYQGLWKPDQDNESLVVIFHKKAY